MKMNQRAMRVLILRHLFLLASAAAFCWSAVSLAAKPASLAALDPPTPEATPVERIHAPPGFQLELLYSVPKPEQGSWVAMTVDDKGRLIVSDQYGALYRLKTPAPGKTISTADIERIELKIGAAQGLLHAFGSLYVVVNSNDYGGRGLYRVRDTDGDDHYDKLELLRKFEEQGGEHGPHAVILGPDQKSLYVVCGDQTALPKYDRSRVPEVWGEDLLLPRIYGRGFMRGVLAPRGWIAKTDPDGKRWEIMATGFRNEYDAAFNRDGELFTYDADMEWDLNTPWYRPTRVNQVISGAEFGWRNGSGKWPDYYLDSFGAVVNIGPGSPTGVCFGYGAKFPAKYQEAFFICDWSYGKLYAVHMTPQGASYSAQFEEFIGGQPLPLTDLLIHPGDGAMYFTIGGRRVQSGLYRVVYTGRESTAPVQETSPGKESREQRRRLEAFHGVQDAQAVTTAWPFLAHPDRALRYAARVAIEHQPLDMWREKALAETNAQAALAALTALARRAGKDLQPQVVQKLARFDYERLNKQQRLDLVRAYALAFLRLGAPTDQQRRQAIQQLDAHYPASSVEENIELCQLFVYLDAPSTAEKSIQLLSQAPSQEEQIAYAKSLRMLNRGWTPALRKAYFEWFVRAQGYRGGASFQQFVNNIKSDATAKLDGQQRQALQSIINARLKPEASATAEEKREFVKDWTVADLVDDIDDEVRKGRDFENGRRMFGAAKCFACHRFNQQGGAVGPDLSGLGGRFSPRDLLESMIEPSKVISDQYAAVSIATDDGKVVTGRIVNLSGDSYSVLTNMLDPATLVNVNRRRVEEIKPSTLSLMPTGLLQTLTKEDVLDLLAYLISRGDASNPSFQE